MNCFDSLPVIFVIIPVYKAEKYIAQAMDSVLGQPYKNIRIVCVDDGSPDDSISVLWDYEKRYESIHVIRRANGGVSRARNTGIEYVLEHGRDEDYVAFLDSDDCWGREAVLEDFGSLAKGMDCIGCTSIRCNNDLTRMIPPKSQRENVLCGGADNRWCHDAFHMGAMFYSVRMLRRYNIRFIPRLRYGEDTLFKTTCLFLAEKIRLVDRLLYIYRENPASTMHLRKYGTEYMPDIIRGYLQTEEFLKPYENENRGSVYFCRVMAELYSLEMITEHYQQWRTTASLKCFLRENPEFEQLIRDLDEGDLSEEHKKMHRLYQSDPPRFRWTNRLSGCVLKIRSMLKKAQVLTTAYEAKRYSQPNRYL